MNGNSKSQGASQVDRDLGMVVLERRVPKKLRVTLAVVAALFAVPAVLSTVAGIMQGESDPIYVGLMILALDAPLLLMAYVYSKRVFRFRERGVSQATWLGERGFQYSQVASFSFSAVRQLVYGIDAGTTFQVRFEPDPSVGARRILFVGTLQKDDGQLMKLRDHVAQAVAQRMAQQLSANHSVPWTRNLTLYQDRVEYRGGREAVILPLAEIADVNIDKGYFHILRKGMKKPAIQGAISAPNFFPGLCLLKSILPAERSASARST